MLKHKSRQLGKIMGLGGQDPSRKVRRISMMDHFFFLFIFECVLLCFSSVIQNCLFCSVICTVFQNLLKSECVFTCLRTNIACLLMFLMCFDVFCPTSSFPSVHTAVTISQRDYNVIGYCVFTHC